MKLLLLFVFFVVFLFPSNQETCSYSFPSIVEISDFSSTTPRNYWFVDVYNGTETNFLRDAIRNCTGCEYSHKITLYFYIFDSDPVSIELDVGPSISYVRFSSSQSDAVQISSLKSHSSLTRLSFSFTNMLVTQPNFFELFPNLQSISTDSGNTITFNSPPTFNHMGLTYLGASILVQNGFSLDSNFTRGLASLRTLYLSGSNIISIAANAFTEMGGLRTLSLANNQIALLGQFVFRGLSNLTFLDLDNNQITAAYPESFYGLNSLTYLTVDTNIGFPVATLRGLLALKVLDIGANGYTHLDSFPFQQMKELTYLRINSNPLECGCELQWLSIVSMYGLLIQEGVCASPPSSIASSVSTYSECGSVAEFSCFNKSINCPSNQVCQNGITDYYCCCPENFRMTDTGECVAVPQCHNVSQPMNPLNGCGCGVGYTLSENCSVCVVINECEANNGNCQHNCANSISSHSCSCNYGYRLVNLTFCEDIDECESPALGCSGYCQNTLGSYNCHCWNGYQQINSSSCSDIDECETENGSCEQLCYNTEGSYFCGCYRGYNHTVGNLKLCQLDTFVSPEALNSNWSNPIMVIAAVCVIVILFILLICQTIVCVVILFSKKSKHSSEAIELQTQGTRDTNNYNKAEDNNNNKAENDNNNNITATEPTSYVEMHSKYYTLDGQPNNRIYTESTHYHNQNTVNTLDRDIVYGEFLASADGDYDNVAFNENL